MSDKAESFLRSRKKNPKQKEFFDEHADSWDSVTVHDTAKVEYITSLLGIGENDYVMDVGTGTGVMIPFYLERNARVLAVDYSSNMISEARRKNPESARLSYKVMDIYDSPFDSEFDEVVCYSCFPHFPDPVRAIDVLSRAVKRGGLFCIAHSSSKEHINHVHTTGGEEICTDYLPEMCVMREFFEACNLDVVFERDDSDYYIIIGRKR